MTRCKSHDTRGASQETTSTNAAGTYYQFQYDAIGQLKVADSSVNTEDRGYAYDSAWNLNWRTNNGSTSKFIVDGKNELTNAFSRPYSYDANGNLVAGNTNHSIYVYDDENRLIQWFSYTNNQYNPVSGDLRTDFRYDGLGRLRIRSEYSYNSQGQQGPQGPGPLLPIGWNLHTTTLYIYDSKRVIQERDGTSNTPTVSYTRGTDLSGSLEGAGGIGGLLGRSSGYSSGNWTNHNFYHADGNGNITYLVNSNQGLAASYRYDPFGNTISLSGGLASANVYRFSSKEFHGASGMYYYLYRFYDPNLQRWLNRDPMGEDGGLNLYSVCRNDTMNGFDPFGLSCATALAKCATATAAAISVCAGRNITACWAATVAASAQCTDALTECQRDFHSFDRRFNCEDWHGWGPGPSNENRPPRVIIQGPLQPPAVHSPVPVPNKAPAILQATGG